MTARTAVTLAGVVLLVAGLSAVKFARRTEPSALPAPVALPQVLDFGRDT